MSKVEMVFYLYVFLIEVAIDIAIHIEIVIR